MRSFREFTEELRKRGYSLKFDAVVKGKSGASHRVDLLARRRTGKTVVGLERRRGGDTTFEIIKTFTIAYDVGAEACYVVDRELEGEERRLAESYRISVWRNKPRNRLPRPP